MVWSKVIKIFIFFCLEVDNFQVWYLCVSDFQIKVERLPLVTLWIGHANFYKEWLLEIKMYMPRATKKYLMTDFQFCLYLSGHNTLCVRMCQLLMLPICVVCPQSICVTRRESGSSWPGWKSSSCSGVNLLQTNFFFKTIKDILSK